jgi:hypothetical protein
LVEKGRKVAGAKPAARCPGNQREAAKSAIAASAKDTRADISLRKSEPFRRFHKILLHTMKALFLKMMVAACCLGVIVACKPAASMKTSETAVVEEKIRKFKAEPSKVNMSEVEKALADLNSKIKELEAREAKVGGAEKDEATRKLSDLRASYNAYNAEFTAARVQASVNKASEATGQALEKAGDAVKDAAKSVGDSLKSDKSDK